jgi:hypothetical protein
MFSLPVREEFGFKRTSCGCRKCRIWCKLVPGFLVPRDLDRLIPSCDEPLAWAEEHLLASKGFQVVVDGVEVLSIGSLVPRRQANGHCHWYGDGDCTIHLHSPYGCAFLSQCSQSGQEAAKVAEAGRTARAEAFAQDGLYARIWRHLWANGFRETATRTNQVLASAALKKIDEQSKHKKRRRR